MEKERRYRTQLHLDEKRYMFIKERAAQYGTSMAEVVRELIDKEMLPEEGSWEEDPLFRVARKPASTGRANGSEEHDTYIYGYGEEGYQTRRYEK